MFDKRQLNKYVVELTTPTTRKTEVNRHKCKI